MIKKLVWIADYRWSNQSWKMEGWYLFGFIPLFVRDVTPRPSRRPMP